MTKINFSQSQILIIAFIVAAMLGIPDINHVFTEEVIKIVSIDPTLFMIALVSILKIVLAISSIVWLIQLARKMIPNAHKIMVAGGRELMFGEDQYQVFDHGANSIVIGDYLTTQGKSASKDLEALEALGFSIAQTCEK